LTVTPNLVRDRGKGTGANLKNSSAEQVRGNTGIPDRFEGTAGADVAAALEATGRDDFHPAGFDVERLGRASGENHHRDAFADGLTAQDGTRCHLQGGAGEQGYAGCRIAAQQLEDAAG
jgi:hypothetical protein